MWRDSKERIANDVALRSGFCKSYIAYVSAEG